MDLQAKILLRSRFERAKAVLRKYGYDVGLDGTDLVVSHFEEGEYEVLGSDSDPETLRSVIRAARRVELEAEGETTVGEAA